MSVINPPNVRHTSQLVDETLIINIPSRIQWLQVPGQLIWLIIWLASIGLGSFGLISADNLSLTSLWPVNGPGLFMLVWLAVWIIIGFSALISLLWQFTGREIVIIDAKKLRIKWQIWGLSWTHTYLMADVGDLRTAPVVYQRNGRYRQFSYWWIRNGPLAFDYGAKTYRFGDGVDEAEAKLIIKLIQTQFPQ